MDKETKQHIDVLQTTALEQGKTISNLMKKIEEQDEVIEYLQSGGNKGLLNSTSFGQRFLGFLGYYVLTWILLFLIGFGYGVFLYW